MKTFVDTFYIVALVNVRDEHHEKANQLVEIYDKYFTQAGFRVLMLDSIN